MKTEAQETIDVEFQNTIQRLGLLACNETTLEAFTEEYRRALENTYRSMMLVRNADKTRKGLYLGRARILEKVLQRQLSHFGLEWPKDTGRKEQSDTH